MTALFQLYLLHKVFTIFVGLTGKLHESELFFRNQYFII